MRGSGRTPAATRRALAATAATGGENCAIGSRTAASPAGDGMRARRQQRAFDAQARRGRFERGVVAAPDLRAQVVDLVQQRLALHADEQQREQRREEYAAMRGRRATGAGIRAKVRFDPWQRGRLNHRTRVCATGRSA